MKMPGDSNKRTAIKNTAACLTPIIGFQLVRLFFPHPRESTETILATIVLLALVLPYPGYLINLAMIRKFKGR